MAAVQGVFAAMFGWVLVRTRRSVVAQPASAAMAVSLVARLACVGARICGSDGRGIGVGNGDGCRVGLHWPLSLWERRPWFWRRRDGVGMVPMLGAVLPFVFAGDAWRGESTAHISRGGGRTNTQAHTDTHMI
mmetsp:Transcript_44675/g.119116  ORF Transcript_44675/g.119116 Transcript_44675/m.119116 type:complete len:133 (+) Transcript_44675:170-568(+)